MNANSNRVAAVVVTYNRLNYLKECIDALRKQTYKNSNIIIVNNGSTDGTAEWLALEKDLIVINQDNCGGAGGFYTGMKYMYENKFDAIWMMDDDGLPAYNQLEELVKISNKYDIDFANALVINRDDHSMLYDGSRYSSERYKDTEFIPNLVLPFNGSFIKRHVIEKIGLIKKEMFIWGDEREYTARIKQAKFTIGTIPSALHYHPLFKGNFHNIVPFYYKWKIALKPSPRDKIFYRNIGYIDKTYGTKNCFKYILYILLRFQFHKLLYCLKYMRMGWKDDFRQKLL